jgi:hypothetical protein
VEDMGETEYFEQRKRRIPVHFFKAKTLANTTAELKLVFDGI